MQGEEGPSMAEGSRRSPATSLLSLDDVAADAMKKAHIYAVPLPTLVYDGAWLGWIYSCDSFRNHKQWSRTSANDALARMPCVCRKMRQCGCAGGRTVEQRRG